MKKLLYVNGCSHSQGAEIDGAHSFRSQFNLDNCFGGLIAQKYGLFHHNDASSAQSNKAIYSSSVFNLLKLLKTYDSSEISVLIGWTGHTRTEVVYDNKLYRICPGMLFDDKPSYIKKFYKSWAMRSDRDVACNDFNLYYFAMKNFLDLYKIDHLFFNAVHCVGELPKHNMLHPLSNNQPDENIFEIMRNDKNFLQPFDDNYSYYMHMREKYNPLEGGRYHHFGVDAHREWADFLIPYIDKKMS